jgi:tRNA modification GTPase
VSRSDTIFALSSGNPPAAIAVVRISGDGADPALRALAGSLPEPRRAAVRELRDPVSGETLDRGLVLRFPGPSSATGEDMIELHLHGGRAIVSAILGALASMDGLRAADRGEFTRRAFENGRIDLTEAEGLADLLVAETQSQRRASLALAGGALSRRVSEWQDRLLRLSAQLEAVLNFSDEGEVAEELPASWQQELDQLLLEIRNALLIPPVERLRDGIRVVIAGPPNAGKSSLLNWLAGRRAAITSAIAGTTRDLVEAPTAIAGQPFLLVDTAGLRDSRDEIEAEGVQRARESLAAADLILWLGAPEDCPDRERSIVVQSKIDLQPAHPGGSDVAVSSETGEGMELLVALLIDRARSLLPQEGDIAINARHRLALRDTAAHLKETRASPDLLIASEGLRLARAALDRLTGRSGVENMLDALFGSFCIGK